MLDVGQGDAILVEGDSGSRHAHRWRAGSRSVDRRARRAVPALGPANRCADPEPPARGPCRRPAPADPELPDRPDLRARDARTRTRLPRVPGRTGPPRPHPRDPVNRRRAPTRLDRVQGPLAGSGRRPAAAAPMAAHRSTTSRSSCLARLVPNASCWPAISRRRSTRCSSPEGCPGWTCSRLPITAAGRRRPARSSTPCVRAWRSCQSVPSIPTATRHRRLSPGSRRAAHSSTGRIGTARSRRPSTAIGCRSRRSVAVRPRIRLDPPALPSPPVAAVARRRPSPGAFAAGSSQSRSAPGRSPEQRGPGQTRR